MIQKNNNNKEDKMVNKDAPITLRINSNLKSRLGEIATKEDRSLSATIRRAIHEYIEKRETREVQTNI